MYLTCCTFQEESICYWCDENKKIRVFGEEAFQLTFISQKMITSGVIKRKFELIPLKSNTFEEQEPLKIVHLQSIRWEDDDAIADEEHF